MEGTINMTGQELYSAFLELTYMIEEAQSELAELAEGSDDYVLIFKEVNSLERKKEQLLVEIGKKVDVWDYVYLRLDQSIAGLEGEKKKLQEEINRLSARIKAKEANKSFLRDNMLIFINDTGSVNKSGNKFIRTDTATYTSVLRDGAVELIEGEAIPDEFLKKTPKLAEIKEYVKRTGDCSFAFIPQQTVLLRR